MERVNRLQWKPLAAYGAVWLVLSAALGITFFLSSSVSTTFASHDAVLRPTVDGWVTVHTGPFLPDVRSPSDSRLGVDIQLGKTKAATSDELVARYAFIASQPDAQVARVEDAMKGLAYDAAARGAVTALLPLILWLALGQTRRHELVLRAWAHKRATALLAVGAVGLGVLAWEPWEEKDPTLEEASDWQLLGDYLPVNVDLPPEAGELEISRDLTSGTTRRLIVSAVDTYSQSKDFYARAAEAAASLELRQSIEG